MTTLLVPSTLFGCYSPWMRSEPEAELLKSGRYELIAELDVPHVEGLEGCGAQALATVLAFGTADQNAPTIAAELPWHDEGGDPVALLLEARRRGAQATIHHGDWEMLAEHVRAGHPPLVMVDSGLEVRTLFSRLDMPKVMHWAVVSGVAYDGSRVLVAKEGGRHHVIEREPFLHRWAKSDNALLLVIPSIR